MKLKTLKDLKGCTCCGCNVENYVDIETLRQEAIKHLKKLEEDRKEAVKLCGHFGEEAAVIGIMDWIKDFFNISEEELK